MKRKGYREIFIFIAGSTPQVVTETIYALAVRKPPVYPDEIYVITTAKGRNIVKDALINKGYFKGLLKEYSIPPCSLKESSFIVPEKAGQPLEDIKTAAENEIMGDLITSFVRERTGDPTARLHCSIAGGRKTMSFYLGSALQLFGRPWDRLYHVLVTPEFESHPEFFYKPIKNRGIAANDKKLNTQNAEILLAELPFIRLREKISLERSSFGDLVKEGQREIDMARVQPEVRINLTERTIAIGSQAVKLTPFHLMVYTAYLRQKANRCKYPDRPYCVECTDCYPSLLDMSTKAALEEMAKDYMAISRSKALDLLHKHKNGLSQDVIRQAISKIKKTLKDQIADETLLPVYSITSLRQYANTRHGVRVEKGKIRIEQ
ncbi:MAG: CRISPR-associated ring nuclease Csm6 [Nitrospirota bacterium]